ncbi:flavodoxin domain-containing protein [Abyssisolibacter fermentans]|uniref:flavodoxin domain-containing protein n=1 Tax=Abyssisolibacter fermentans TaxID=1766203 RepID=UPI00082A2682|nr:flavodoxin domain-containing protein [Abyssisolibacter fermentans]
MSILIVYDSKYGFTDKCVEYLTRKLEGDVNSVNLQVDKVHNLSSYSKVIIGGSIYAGMLRKRVKKFCLENLSVLQNKEAGLFITCTSTGEQALKQMQMNFPSDLYEKAVAKDYFGGEIIMDKAKFFDRLIIKMVSKGDKGDVKKSNGMDVDRIKEFANKMNGN